MNAISNEIDSITISVILPIYEVNHAKSRASNGQLKNIPNFKVNYESSIESLCFSKPLISYTIKSLKKIPNIKDIILASSSCRQEQIQELVSETVGECEQIKYINIDTKLPTNGHSKGVNNHHQINQNRLLKQSFNLLKHDPSDIIMIHDPNMAYIDEKIISNLCLEAMNHGAACVSTNDKPENLLFKLEESNIDEENESQNFNFNTNGSKNRQAILSGAIVSDYFETNYRIGYKPEAFKYSIFSIIFENCSDEDLENDVDCITLARKYADIRVKLVFENNKMTNSNYSKRICCVQHYLKEIHKQALIISNKTDQDAVYLNNMLQFQSWNIEMCVNGMDKEAWLKINDMLGYRNMTDGLVLIKFCENLTDLEEFELNFNIDGDEEVVEEQDDLDLQTNKNEPVLSTSNLVNYVLFMIKSQTVNCSVIKNAQDAVKIAIKKNISNLSKIWYISILYESLDSNIVNLINYVLKDRDRSIRGQIFEFN